jgi:hypothetical protein
MKHIFTGVCLCLTWLVFTTSPVLAQDDFSVSPASLAFGSVPKTQSKSLTFQAVSKKVAEYTVTVTAPFTLNPSSGKFGVVGTTFQSAADTITVTLPANLPPGAKSGTVTVTFKPKFGNNPNVTRTVALSATVTDTTAPPAGFDLSTTLQNGIDSINNQGTIRTAVVKITGIVQGGSTAGFKTRCLVSIDGAAEIESYNGLIVYAPGAGQVFTLAHPVPVSVRTMNFRIITDPDNTAAEVNETNNTKTLNKTFN